MLPHAARFRLVRGGFVPNLLPPPPPCPPPIRPSRRRPPWQTKGGGEALHANKGERGGPNRTEVRRGEGEEGQSGDEEGDTQQVLSPPLSILKPVPFTKSQVHSTYHEEAFLSLPPLPSLLWNAFCARLNGPFTEPGKERRKGVKKKKRTNLRFFRIKPTKRKKS